MKNLLLIGGVIAAFFLLRGAAPMSEEEKLIQAFIDKMKANPEWLASEQMKATQNGISLDQQLRESAIWMIAQGYTL